MEGSAAAAVAAKGDMFPALHGPDEVILSVFDHIDVRSLANLRAVSRNMRGFIDRYHNTIYTSQAKSEVTRITRSRDFLVEQFTIYSLSPKEDGKATVSLVEAIEVLSRWVTKRGIWLDRWTSIGSLHLLVDYLARETSNLEPGITFAEKECADYYEVALAVLNLHVQHHSPQHLPYVREVNDDTEFVQALKRSGTGCREEQLAAIYETTMLTPHLRSKALIAAPTDDTLPLDSIPPYILTPWKRLVHEPALSVCSLEWFCELLGVPDLPGDAVFAYGTRSSQVYDIISFEAVIQRGPLPLDLKAFILENIVVF